jgi:uncharacterized membrane protein
MKPQKKETALEELIVEIATLRSEVREMHQKVSRIDQAFRMARIFRILRYIFIIALFLGLAKVISVYTPAVAELYENVMTQFDSVRHLVPTDTRK